MKKIISFTIKGNQENPQGNPIPYFRTTQGGQFNKGAKRYHAWKDYVRAAFIDALEAIKREDRIDYAKFVDFSQKKPIKKAGYKQKVSIMIGFRDKSHADSDNIFKGIADALFMDDKYVAGDFDYFYPEERAGFVRVKIQL